jgi:hypothetical protein
MTLVPAREFRLLRGAEGLADYQRTPAGKDAPFLHFLFCRPCGVRPFPRGGALPQFGGEFYAVNVACLDDATDEELAAAPVKYVNGRDNDGAHEPAHHYL